jgi:hypothetical protein
MISSFILKRPVNTNININNYCMNSTKEYIRKITEKYNLEKNKLKIVNPLKEQKISKHSFIYHSILLSLSLTVYALSFYKRLQ